MIRFVEKTTGEAVTGERFAYLRPRPAGVEANDGPIAVRPWELRWPAYVLRTATETVEVRPGDWIVTRPDGSREVCRGDGFMARFAPEAGEYARLVGLREAADEATLAAVDAALDDLDNMFYADVPLVRFRPQRPRAAV